MGTIVPRTRKDGSTGFQAQIVIRRTGQVDKREVKTFDRRPAAAAWIKKREKELREGVPSSRENPLLADVIDHYIRDSLKAIGRTKAQVLRSLKTYDIAEKRCADIGSADIVALAKELAATRAPATVSNYLAHLASIFAVAPAAWGHPLDPAAMKAAATVAKRLGYTSKARERDRRPTLDELERLLTHFEERQARRPDSAPMARIIVFALFSTRRQEEISRSRWVDLDEAGSRLMIRDMKNPGEKIGNDVWCELPPEALRIALAMPRDGERIFPYSTDAISAGFTRGAAFLEIEDLHFHDLRHDGVSRLFEMGRNIPQVASVSGHRSWTSLKRYTHLRQSGDKYAGWKWLDVLGVPA